MHEATDMDLLRQYADGNSDTAFAALVSRHVNLVYSAALRKTGNPHVAEDITQAVFVILARKAGRIPVKTILPGWLYQTARLTASSFLRGEIRRVRREQEAYMQTEPHTVAPEETWEQLSPLLDDAMGQLADQDRAAVVLRFFGGKSFAEVATAAGVSENAAKKRVSHALEKLHRYFSKHGVSSTTAIIAGAISTHSIQAAPVALAKTVTAVAIAKGAAVSTSTLTLIQGALKIMAWTKAKTAIVGSIVVLLAAGTTTITVKEIREHRHYPWQVEDANTQMLNRVPPQVKIVPTIFLPRSIGGYNMSNNKMIGMGQSINSLLSGAYGTTRYRIVYSTPRPEGYYDFIANLPKGNDEALRQEIERQFHLVGRKEVRETDVLVLAVKSRNAPGLTPSANRTSNVNNDYGAGWWRGMNLSSTNIASRVERYLKIPVVNQTGLAGRFNIDLKWDEQVEGQSPDAFKQALLDQLGLELTPANMPIEMLVVEKAK